MFNALISGDKDGAFGTYMVRYKYSMVFTESFVPISGRMVYSIVHTHPEYMKDMLLIAGRAAQLSLQYNSSHEYYMNRATRALPDLLSMQQAKQNIVNAASRPKEKPFLICETAPPNKRFEVVKGVRYERRADPECREWKFNQYDPFVMIAFNDLISEKTVAQHSLFRIYTEADRPEDPPVSLMYQATCHAPGIARLP